MKRISKRLFALLLTVVMLIGIMPATAIATDTTGSVTNYADFMKNLKVLEGYAKTYAAEIYGKDPAELVLNFIRTGVERYQDDNWNTLAGHENTGFTNYVAAQDAEKGTTAMNLKDIVIQDFYLPNGNKVDFGHMFGCMNISYVAPGSADLSGWAGDICDLLQYSLANIDDINANTNGSIESMAAYIQENCFGVDASGAFGWDDFWGDMDAYYLVSEYKKANGTKTLSELMEAYFGSDLNDIDRTVYFMNNRFAVADSNDAVRKAIYEAYTSDVGISILESKRGLTSYKTLRQACCYAVADYIYSQAKGNLIEGTVSDETAKNGYYTVFSTESSILAPGITQDIKYAQTVDGKQIVYYVATVDVKRDDVDILINYNNNAAPVDNNIGLQTVENQVKALLENYRGMKDDNGDPIYENFNAIVSTNGAGYNTSNGTPAGLVVMKGVEYYPVGAPGFFAILQDGTAVIGDVAKYNELKAEGKIKEAIQAFGSVLVKDGKVCVTKSANYVANRASRTAIGITAEGKVVMMVLDGRQLPRSAGGAMEEIAQIMLEAGCVEAVNLDGGGSTTYLSKPAGKDEIELVNVPSDGTARNVATSLVAVSTAAPSTAFDTAIISSDYEYITAGTSMQFNVTGVSNTGNAAVIPDGAYWQVVDKDGNATDLATIDEDGVFTAAWSEEEPITGDVTVEFIVNGESAGSKVIHIVIPDDIKFAEDRITATYGVPKTIDVSVWYQGYPVAFTPLRDAFVFFDYEFDQYGYPTLYFESDAGYINGLEFVGSDAKGVRTVPVYAAVMIGKNFIATGATVNLYYADETTFDFANATMGNRSFAWTREIENARTLDNQLYYVSDPDSDVVIDYTFALDMTAIDFPAQLEPMKSMLPTYSETSTAWDYMLQLAERICTQTNVTIRAEFSQDLSVDISDLKILTEYFDEEKTIISLDPNNVLTIVCYWKNQSQPIDPATANSLCILTGIKATVKDTAAYFDSKVAITNNGTVSYDIYLAASSLYSFAQDTGNQAQFSLYPYIHEEDCRSDFVTDDPNADENETVTNNDKGAHFSSQYIDFADAYLINSNSLNGWVEEDGDYYYYVNNEPVTGEQIVTDRHDATKERFYEFDETGKLVSENGITGLVEIVNLNTPLGYDLYYAVLGEAKKGWQQIDGNNYYFDPDTGKAVDGEQKIKELVYPTADDPNTDTYTYTFENHVLVRGDLRKEKDYKGNVGVRYRWAGNWMKSCWFEVDGNTYYGTNDWRGFVLTGYQSYIRDYTDGNNKCFLFDENGILQNDFAGSKEVTWTKENKTYTATFFFKNGRRFDNEFNPDFKYGLHQGSDGCYYFVTGWDGSIAMNAIDYSVTESRANRLVAAGTYDFDSQGRMTDKLVEVEDKTGTTPIETTVTGSVVTVTSTTPCRVVYVDGDQYVALDAISNGGSYNFSAPTDSSTSAAKPENVVVIVSGDVDNDGQLDLSDLHEIKEAMLGEELGGLGEIAADVNGDDTIDIIDIILMAKSLVESTNSFHKGLEWR